MFYCSSCGEECDMFYQDDKPICLDCYNKLDLFVNDRVLEGDNG